jgi:Asp-tRNA(Asn)/Glu-tRNA(Gln) amidotransferase A subunit family amidase
MVLALISVFKEIKYLLMKFFWWTALFLLFSVSIWGQDSLSINKEEIKNALKVSALEFTDQEIDSLSEGAENNRKAYQANRQTSIGNEVPPALLFNPLPPGFQISQNQQPVVWSKRSEVKRPDNLEALAFWNVRDLGYLIKSRELTSVELTQLCLERLKKYDDTLHCVISLTEELALEQAQRADEEIAAGKYRGPLHGIPYGAKDLLAVPGYKTTWGATPYKDQTIEETATVIRKLEEAGAVLVAKLTLGALAWGDVWFDGKTRNPWNPEKGSSGSSAGSASAVAAGLVPFAIGTETLGSIVSPSTVCGTTGLRPTFGRVSRHGAMALSWTMDKIGPITRTVEDCALVFNVIRGEDPLDPYTMSADFNYDGNLDVRGLKVGYLKSAFENNYGFKKQDSLLLEKIRAKGIELVPIELPELPQISFILTVEAAAAFDELTRSGRDEEMVRQVRNAWPNVFREARLVPAVEYIQANRLRSILIAQMDEVLKDIDVYLTPSWSGPNLRITNFTGHPQVVFPNGFIDGEPTSISIVGHLFDEATLLEFSKFVQDLGEWHLQHPE